MKRILVSVSVIFVFAALLGSVLWKYPILDVSQLKAEYPVWVWSSKEKAYRIQWRKKRPVHWRTLNEISEAVQNAVVLSEDWAFYQHSGIDFLQVREAVEDSFEDGKRVRGASTITQQVVKNVFLNSERSVIRKILEWGLALRLESVLSKRKILEVYLNIVEWGSGIYGIESASQAYFQRHPNALTLKEAAFLAMLLPSPKRYAVSFRKHELTPYAQKTIDAILLKMVRAHFISQDEYEIERDIPLSFEEAPVVMEEEF